MQRKLTTGLAILLFAPSAWGWGPEGHRLVARIAAGHLSAQAQARVQTLLAADGQDLATAMATAATWADEIKSQAIGAGTSDWHFLDLASSDTAAQLPERCPGNDCVTAQLRIMTANVQAGTSLKHGQTTFTPGQQLQFVIHFMGDLHQPLHCATNADAGGNCLKTQGFKATELHATWDTGLVAPLLLDSQGKALTETVVAAALDQQFQSQFAGFADLTDFDQMALESHSVAFQAAYGPMIQRKALPKPEPRPYLKVSISQCATKAPDFFNIKPAVDLTKYYNDATLDAVRLQLAKAGYRLAALLNNTLQ